MPYRSRARRLLPCGRADGSSRRRRASTGAQSESRRSDAAVRKGRQTPPTRRSMTTVPPECAGATLPRSTTEPPSQRLAGNADVTRGRTTQAHVRLCRRLAGGFVRDPVVGGDGWVDGEAERAFAPGRRGRRRRPVRGAGRTREQRERGAGHGGRATDGRGARVDDGWAGDRRGERRRLRGAGWSCVDERGSADGQKHGHQREQVGADGHGGHRTGRGRQGSAGAGEADAGATEADGDAAGVSSAPAAGACEGRG